VPSNSILSSANNHRSRLHLNPLARPAKKGSVFILPHTDKSNESSGNISGVETNKISRKIEFEGTRENLNAPQSSVTLLTNLPLHHGEVELCTIPTKQRILIVDDVTSCRKVLSRLLKNCGCETVEAGDGQECLDIVARESFDLILMDFEMPVMNGPTATARLRELNCSIPVVGVTGNVLKADTDHFLEQGALEVLHKPLDVVKVKDLISRRCY
jgi:CheY-like chemotaxis protein